MLGYVADNLGQVNGVKTNQENITKVEEVEEGCTGHDSRRAAQLRMIHTPQGNDNMFSEMDANELNYGHDISQTS